MGVFWGVLLWLGISLSLTGCDKVSYLWARVQGMPDLAAVKPEMRRYSAAEIDAVVKKSGLTDCFWVGTVSHDTFNILSPDTGVVYWLTQVKLPVGAKLALHGEYPHARYLSFNSYDEMSAPLDRINDQMIMPDAGSVNPFLPNARRDAAARRYTVFIAEREMLAGKRIDDASRPRNTLFATTESNVLQIWMRVYVPDSGRDVKGGVALPTPELTLADGRQLRGEALCQAVVVKEGAVRDYKASAPAVRALYNVPGAKAPYHPAQSPVSWGAFYNPPLVIANTLINTPFAWLRERLDNTRRAGFYSTLDNIYMMASIDKRYGEVLVLTGRAPTTPRTHDGTPVMTAAQLRYWSLCKGRSIADMAVDTCLYDEQVPTDSRGYYRIVVSAPEQRPANARAECGVAWLGWGVGDGLGNPDGGYLIFRHMMAAADFPHSLWATRQPGDEKTVLGEYYPSSKYQSRTDFEALGCQASTAQ